MTNQSTDATIANAIPKFESTLVIAFPDVFLAGPKILLSANATSTHGQPITEWSHYFTRQSAKKPSASYDSQNNKSKIAVADAETIIYSATTLADPQQQQQQKLSLLTIAAAPPTTEQASNLCKAIVDHAQASNTHKIILLAASNFVVKEQKTHVVQIHY
ncbi:hypothetical protein BGX26_002016, partial [Mortierella sp. AD094]